MLTYSVELKISYDLKEQFRDIFNATLTRDEAEAKLEDWKVAL